MHKSKVKVKQKRNVYIHIYIHTYIHIYRYTDIHTHIHAYTHTHTHIHIITHIQTHIYTYVKLFVICFEIPHPQIPHHVATSQLNPNKSQITGFDEMRNTRAGNPRTEASKKVNKSGLKGY